MPTLGAQDVIDAASAMALPVAVVSNNAEAAVKRYLDLPDLGDRVPLVIGRPYADPARMKPHPALVDAAVSALGIPPGSTLFVGDSTTDLQAAGRAGARRIAVASAGVSTPGIIAGPIALSGSRYATAFEWMSGRRAAQNDWPAVVREAARLSDAAIVGVPMLSWPCPTDSADILDDKLGSALTEQSDIAAAALRRLIAAGNLVLSFGDLQPANALIDPMGRAWLLDFEFARAAPREWDPGKLLVLSRRFGEPADVEPLLGEWRQLDQARLAVCADAQEVLIVLWLVRMAREGTAGAAEEARRRAATLARGDLVWRHPA